MNIIHKIKGGRFFKNIAIYTSFAVLQKCVPFLLYPLIARILTEEEVGYYILYQAIYVLALPLFTLCTDTAASVNFYKLASSDFRCYLTDVLGTTSVFFLVAFVCFLFFCRQLAQVIDFPVFWLLLSVLSVFPRFIINLVLSLFRCNNKALPYGVLAALSTLFNNLLGLYLVFSTTLSWKGIILGVCIGDTIMSIICMYILIRQNSLDFRFVGEYVKDSLKIGVPLCFHMVGSWLSNSLSRFFISTLIGIAATGSYGIGATFAMVLNLIIDSFNLAFGPYLSQRLVTFNANDKEAIMKVSLLYYALIILAATAIILVGYYGVVFIFGEKYSSTRAFIIPLIVSSALNGFYKVHVNYLFFSKKTYLITSVTFVLGVCNIGLSYIMIKYYGILGAAYTNVIIAFCSYIAIAYMANRQYPMNWFAQLKLIFRLLK